MTLSEIKHTPMRIENWFYLFSIFFLKPFTFSIYIAGELTDELESGDHIVEFVSGGPKNYAYETIEGKQTCKIRGFSLNYTNAQRLNFGSVRDMVANINPKKTHTYRKRKLEDREEPPSKVIFALNPNKISRDKYNNVIYNKEEKKEYRIVYDKRVILQNFDTVPFGF